MQAVLYNVNTNDVIMVLKCDPLIVTDERICDQQGNGLKGYNATVVGYKLVNDATDLTDSNSPTGYIETVVGLATPDHTDLDIEVQILKEETTLEKTDKRAEAITNLLASSTIPYDPDV